MLAPVTISQLIERLSDLREEIGDCPVCAAAIGMVAEFEVVEVMRGRPERSESAHGAERPSRAVLGLSLD